MATTVHPIKNNVVIDTYVIETENRHVTYYRGHKYTHLTVTKRFVSMTDSNRNFTYTVASVHEPRGLYTSAMTRFFRTDLRPIPAGKDRRTDFTGM